MYLKVTPSTERSRRLSGRLASEPIATPPLSGLRSPGLRTGACTSREQLWKIKKYKLSEITLKFQLLFSQDPRTVWSIGFALEEDACFDLLTVV